MSVARIPKTYLKDVVEVDDRKNSESRLASRGAIGTIGKGDIGTRGAIATRGAIGTRGKISSC